jgi:hypothetical protein
MAYGLLYTSDFDSFQPLLTYRLNIFKKDFVGASETILLSGNPAIHEWQEDDPKAPIKGSTLKVSILVNSVDDLALTNFYSEDDYGWYCELIRLETDEKLFRGYLLQDDSQELQVDFTHEIQLTFTDGLGLLKDVTLDEAAVITGVPLTTTGVTVESYIPSFFSTIQSTDPIFAQLIPGSTFTITSGGLAGTFTVIGVNIFSGLYIVQTNSNNLTITAAYTTDIITTIPYPLTGYIPLIDIYKLCLKSIFIDTGLNIYSRLFPINGTTERLLEDTFVQAETFSETNNWMNCYDILEQINSRFNLSLFQAHGTYNLMRWDELYRYTTNSGATLQYHTYSNDFIYTATSTNSDVWLFKKGDDLEVGVLKSINRANQFVRETFNYQQPANLLCNSNGDNLGELIREFNVGTKTIRDYVLNSWYDGPFSPIPERFIRITFDNDVTSETYNQEESRELAISGNTGSAPQSAKSCDIPISKGDGIELSFKYRTSNSEPGPVNNVFIITLDDGTTVYKLNNNGSWTISGGFTYSIPGGDNANIYHDVNIVSNEVPVSGIINVYLDQASSSLDQTFYKDLSFTINYFINKSNRIIGHTHTDSQSLEIKNNIDKEIYLDDSPRTSINGALYLESYTNLLRDLTVRWTYPSSSIIYPRLGQGTTQEALFSTYKMRSKYEGRYLYINQEDVMLTILAVFVDNQNFNFFRYASGKMTIDYKTGFADLSLIEIIDSPTGDFVGASGIGIESDYLAWAATRLYEFNYLYEKS